MVREIGRFFEMLLVNYIKISHEIMFLIYVSPGLSMYLRTYVYFLFTMQHHYLYILWYYA